MSHDRTFLTNVTRRVCWLERGRLRETDRSFARFDEWMEEVLAEEEKQQARLDTKLAQEARWLHRGVTARRRRNQGRLARLHDMRAERASLLGRPTRANIVLREGEVRSRTVIEAKRVSKSYPREGGGERVLVRDFSTRILRGDRIGILGPNGAGKSTLLRMLIGELAPDEGSVKVADPLAQAYFDQQRSRLDPAASLWDTLCPGGGDTVAVQGGTRHVVGYLKDFLFEPDQMRSPVSTLSGGERNRLLLALILAQPSDLLVLDEPTNDLDMDTLDLLEELLGDYGGTLLVVSHDRDFLDRLVTSVIAVEGDGRVREYAGGYSDYRRQREPDPRPGAAAEAGKTRAAAPEREKRPLPARLSYNEQRELDQLPDRIGRLEAEIGKLEAGLADPDLYRRDAALFGRATDRLAAARAELETAEERWLVLEEKRDALAGAQPS
ncbi:MAG: ATP-binding cassette domain-containing protein [Alphaproteobacteria bacterium]